MDAWRFESLLAAARKDAADQPERARHDLGQALALWRGPAYAEFADEEWAAVARRWNSPHWTARARAAQ